MRVSFSETLMAGAAAFRRGTNKLSWRMWLDSKKVRGVAHLFLAYLKIFVWGFFWGLTSADLLAISRGEQAVSNRALCVELYIAMRATQKSLRVASDAS
jgi:hypothetical protein